MRPLTRRRGAVLAAIGLLAGLLPVLLASPANAASVTTANSCTNTAQAGTSALDIVLDGSAAPDPIELGTPDDPLTPAVDESAVTLSGGSFGINVPPTVLLAGYGLNLLTVGVNNIPASVKLTILGSNTSEGSLTYEDILNPGVDGIYGDIDPVTLPDTSLDDSIDPGTAGLALSVFGTTTIVDPTPANKTSGDETATPLSVLAPLPATDWHPTGGNIAFSLGASATTALVGPGGVIAVTFSCVPGTNTPAGCGPLPLVPCTGTAPVPAAPIDTVTVLAPPTAPVCSNVSASVGVDQSVPINITFGPVGSGATCTDVNGNIDPATVTASVLSPPAGSGTLTPGVTPGSYTYAAPSADPGAVTFTFTVKDDTAEGIICNEGDANEFTVPVGGTGCPSNTATATITVLANQCDATSADCDLTQTLVQPIAGSSMTLAKVPGIVLFSGVLLNGEAQVSTGNLQDMTVTNARGTAAGWSLSAYSTDLAPAGVSQIDLTPLGRPGVFVPACTNAGGASPPLPPGTLVPADPAGFSRLCIPGNNLGWNTSAAIAHDIIHGDVAVVNAGPDLASAAADWLTQLAAAGTNLNTVNGLGGLGEVNVLCSSPLNHGGGTFACDAALYLGIPASAGAGIYGGALVLTLV